ncbi:DUF6449 domain-containing protein [Anaeromicropila herbilytica]|uniref:DUF6449 domain-containing protein n=1 Tax=Anaeromicropila herbilytica TaxID=2785025 RepID=A0A7R7EMZ2_9FIRM|nr:DUF6449 domain-containing protein [Anaeromicropila herbilytica]BCN31591.1 hypothetical protein bsdtb5_28860 [Anaeromicropila herbilytica]
MTSRNLFFKLMKEDIKRRIWTIALASIVFFFSYPVLLAIMIEKYNSYQYKIEHVREQILHFVGIRSELGVLIVVCGAAICGLSGFFYLHSKKKVDFYHSIPVRREALFAVSYINGLLIYLVPYIISILISFIILSINHVMSGEIFHEVLKAIGINFLFYSLIYTVIVIAVMLTGNFIISCFGTAVLLIYGPCVLALKEAYFSTFFHTYYMKNQDMDGFVLFLSPIGRYIETIQKSSSEIGGNIVITLIVTILLIILALFLYTKRPSEAAGKAMAFSISKPVIKIMLVVPLTLAGGILFREVTYGNSQGWFFFGLVIAFIISYAIIEIIYNFDIRCAFLHKKELLTCAGMIAVVILIFELDVTHYDSYLPSKSDIKTMSVSVDGLDEDIHYSDKDTTYINGEKYQLERMKLTNFDNAYDLVKAGIKNINHDEDGYMEGTYGYNVKYTLKNGKEVYRAYKLTSEDRMKLIKKLYENQEFKEAHYPIYQLDAEYIKKISCYNTFENKEFSLNQEEKNQLVEDYKADLSNLTLDEHAKNPLAYITIRLNNENLYDYPVYSSFSNTIKFLNNHGFNATDGVTAQVVKEITISNNQDTSNDNTTDNMDGNVMKIIDEGKTIKYQDQQKIRQILEGLVEDQHYYMNQAVINVEDMVRVDMVVKKDNYGNIEKYNCYFRKGNIPDFVKKDIGYIE